MRTVIDAASISGNAASAPSKVVSPRDPPDNSAAAFGSMPIRRLACKSKYGCNAGRPVQLIVILLPAERCVTIGKELPLNVQAAAAAAGALVAAMPMPMVERTSATEPSFIVH